MLPIISKPPITRAQKRTAILIAGTVDFLQVMALPALGFGYIFDDFLDIVAAILLIATCGFKWQFILAFLIELAPVVDIFPTWTALVLTLPVQAAESQVQVPRLAPPPLPPA